MSFLSGKPKDKDPFSKNSQFYVEFLGWVECRALRGRMYTGPVIKELRRRQGKLAAPPKLTIQVSKKDLKITQEVDEKKKNIRKIKFPTIPARDVTFVHQATRPEDGQADDIVACIYLGYMPRTQHFVHIHVYRFDEPHTASVFASQMSAIVDDNSDHIREVEIDLAGKGYIDDPKLTSDFMPDSHATDSAVGSTSSNYSDDEAPTFTSDEIDPDLQSLKDVQAFDSVADELQFRLQVRDGPLLLPPKDYDTISRAHGNLEQINKRRCLNLNIVGNYAAARDRNGSNESGVDLASPGSETLDAGQQSPVSSHRSSADGAALTKLHPNPITHRDSPSASPRLHHQAKTEILNKPASYEAKLSPQVQHKPSFPDFDTPHYSKPAMSPGTPPRASTSPLYPQPKVTVTGPFAKADYVYPPKVIGRPVSPMHQPVHSRQNSLNSQSSSEHDPRESGPPIAHYRGGSSNDIYTMPFKSLGKSQTPAPPANDELPPDYLDDLDDDTIQFRGPEPLYSGPPLTRSMPADLIRSEMNVAKRSRPNSGELRHIRRTESPVNMGGPNRPGSSATASPLIQRVGSTKR